MLAKCWILAFSVVMVARISSADILGHSGVVFHVDKHGHWGGHSSHYDYRYYPEKSLLGYLIDHHHLADPHHLADDAYELIPDSGYHVDPYFYYGGGHHNYH